MLSQVQSPAPGVTVPSPAFGPGTSFAVRLSRLRKAAGLSQTDLAGDDLSPSYVSLLESGKRTPSSAVVSTLAARLGCTASMLWEGEHSERERRLSLELSYARLALTHGGLPDAQERLRALLDEPDLDLHRRDEATLLLGRAYERGGEFDRAIEVLTPLFSRSVSGNSHLPPSSVGVKLCFCCLEVGDVQQAVAIGQQAMDATLAQGLGGTRDYYRLGATLLWGHHELGNLSHAMAWARQLIREAEQNQDERGGATIYWNAALLADSMGDLSEALHLSERALSQLTEADDSRDLVKLRLSIADMQLRTDPPPADQVLSALSAMRDQVLDLGSQVDHSNWNCLVATAHLVLGDVEAAGRHAATGLASTAHMDHEIAVDARVVAGDVAWASGSPEEAVGHYRAGMRLLNGMTARRGLVRLWRELGNRFRDLHEHRLAADCFDQALNGVRVPDRSAALRSHIAAAVGRRAGSSPFS